METTAGSILCEIVSKRSLSAISGSEGPCGKAGDSPTTDDDCAAAGLPKPGEKDEWAPHRSTSTPKPNARNFFMLGSEKIGHCRGSSSRMDGSSEPILDGGLERS